MQYTINGRGHRYSKVTSQAKSLYEGDFSNDRIAI